MSSTPLTGKDRILHEATRMFIEQGYHRLSMRALADAAEISKAGIYHHFKDKESLFLSVVMYHLDALSLIVARNLVANGSVRERISIMVQDIFACSPEQRAIIRVARQEIEQLSADAQSIVKKAYHRSFIGNINTLMAQGIDNGELRAVEPTILTWALLGILHPYLYIEHNNSSTSSHPPVETLLTIFFDGAAQPVSNSLRH